ncbi:MAG TPA: hypothetical protein VGB08_10150 [Allosphingosinicella sp.]
MEKRLTASALAALVIAAAALGIHLGESAIDQINPLYYQGAAVHPRDRGAAVDETLARPQAPRFAELYGWAEGQDAHAADCGDCVARVARDAYRAGTHFAVVETGWHTEARPAADYAPEPQPQSHDEQEAEAGPQPEPFVVERYAGFAIEEKPTVAADPIEVAAAQQE